MLFRSTQKGRVIINKNDPTPREKEMKSNDGKEYRAGTIQREGRLVEAAYGE